MCEILTPLVKGARGSKDTEYTEEKLRVKGGKKGGKAAETMNKVVGGLPEGRDIQSMPPPHREWS